MLIDDYLKVLEGKRLYSIVHNAAPFVMSSYWYTNEFFTKYYDHCLGFPLVSFVNRDKSGTIIPEYAILAPAREIFKKYLTNPSIIREREEILSKAEVDVDALYRSHSYAAIQAMDENQAIEDAASIMHIIWDSNGAVLFSAYFDRAICEEILKESGRSELLAVLPQIWDKGVELADTSFDVDQHIAFLNDVIAGDTKETLLSNHQYIGGSYYDVKDLTWTETYLGSTFGYPMSQEDAQQQLSVIQEELKSKKESFQQWYDTCSSGEKLLIDYFQAIMKLRDRRKNLFHKAITVYWRVTQRLFEQAGLETSLIPSYTLSELKQGSTYLHAHADEIKKRTQGFFAYGTAEGDIQSELCDVDVVLQKAADYNAKFDTIGDATNIKGVVACKGKVVGRVRKVLKVTPDIVLAEGEILVAGMTRPEYVPLMKMAAAIVTDEGGITCHAAIVSRELKKPCIIGTKVATRLLNDGDLIEVDAEQGIVRKIS